jgi:hypothetical protein
MNPLDTYPGVRKALYLILWVVGLILTVWQVGVGVVDGAAYVGYTAQQNVNDTKKGLHNG